MSAQPAPPAAETAAPVVPVILSGGSGTRLWPVSRESFPKQFWPLVSERSMIEETARRARGPGFAPPIVVCNQDHRFLVAEQMRLAGIVGRASCWSRSGAIPRPPSPPPPCWRPRRPESVLWMMAADAAITDLAKLHERWRRRCGGAGRAGS